MRKLLLLLTLCSACLAGMSQNIPVKWGEEFKVSRGGGELSVFCSDKSGIYLKESHMALKSYFVIGATLRESATLIKVDHGFNMLYKNDFNRELRGKEFEQFFWFGPKLYLIASDYDKRERAMILFASEIDKNTGELMGDFMPIAQWAKEDRKDQLAFNVQHNEDSTRMVIVSMTMAAEKKVYEVQTLDMNLKKIGKPVVLKTEFEADTYDLEDVRYTTQGTIALVGREFEFIEGKKKKLKNRVFSRYRIRLFSKDGKKITDFNTDVPGRWLVSARLREVGNELVLASFYSKEKRAKHIEGMVVERLSTTDGHTISSSVKDINAGSISEVEASSAEDDDDGDDESRKERKEREKLAAMKDEEEGFNKTMSFHTFSPTADGGLVILAEEAERYVVSRSYYTPSSNGRGGGTTTTVYYLVSENGNLMMSKIDKAGNIAWLSILPKNQREVSPVPYGGLVSNYWNTYNAGRPYYGGFGVVAKGNEMHLIFNDHRSNAKVVRAGQKVRQVSSFGKSDCYDVVLNTQTGNYQRRLLFSNRDVPTSMPRHGRVLGETFYIVGKEDRTLGRTKVALGSFQVKG